MPTPHNEAREGEICKTVIMPGDPMRAKYIAEKYLSDYVLVNKVRGMLAYSGYYKGKKVTVMAHGMGNPSIGIYTYELFNNYNVDEIIRIGSCGSIVNNVDLRNVILVSNSYSDSNYAKIIDGKDINLLKSNDELNNKIISAANNLNMKLIKTNVYCTDVFYNDSTDYDELYNNHGCSAVEMETFALFYNALKLNKKASCILTVSDKLITEERLSSSDRQNSFDDMIVLALESTLK